MEGLSFGSDCSSRRDEMRCALAADLIRQHGTLRFRALGSSMVPSIWPGEVLQARAAHIRDIECGDVVLFLRNSRLWAHRVVCKTASTLTTRGDSLEATDDSVTAEELLGRVVGICRVGQVVSPELKWGGRISAGLIRRSAMVMKIAIRCHGLMSKMRDREQASSHQSVSCAELPTR